MKVLHVWLACIVCCVFSFLLGSSVGPVSASFDALDTRDVVRCKVLIAETVQVAESVKIGQGERRILLQSDQHSAGVWLTGLNNRAISIYDTGSGSNQQTSIGVYRDTRHSNKGLNAAIGADKDGGFLQLIDSKDKFKRIEP